MGCWAIQITKINSNRYNENYHNEFMRNNKVLGTRRYKRKYFNHEANNFPSQH